MQIDVLSQNTLKLTLSRLDMFDMDIKYESLSGKNPDTKRLLSHVLRTVKLDKSAGVDFSGERLFVEAFPRPDGGCMLYISSLEERVDKAEKTERPEKRALKLTAKPAKPEKILCSFDSLKNLENACKSLLKYNSSIESALFTDENEYRMSIVSDNKKLTAMIVAEFGEVLDPEHELPFTNEHYKTLAPYNAIERLTLTS
jgi:negative regulator of genetic competence, sporulation and motility